MKLSFTHSPYWIIPIVIIAAAVTYIMYKNTRHQLPLIPGGVVSLLRFLLLSVLGVLLLDLLLNSLTKLRFPPIVVVLQDVSESMLLHKDSSYIRKSYPEQLKKMMGALPEEEYLVEGYRFDAQLRPRLNPDSLSYNGGGTNIASAIKEVQNIYQNQNLGAIVVLSDGIITGGANPVYSLEGSPQPVFSVLMGDTTLQKDIKIREVIFNELAYLNTDIPVKVKIANDGFDAASLRVILQQGEKVLDTKNINLSKTAIQGEVDFVIRPSQVGLQQFTVNVSQLEGEITYRNNTRTFSVNVLENRVKIAVFGGSPHPDLGALNEAMAHEDGYIVSEFLLKGKGEYYTSPLSGNLKDFDLFILHNFPNSPADAPVVQKILTEVRDRKVPVIYYIGMFTDLNTMRPLFEYMAIAPESINPKSEEVVPDFNSKIKSHSTFTFDDNWIKMMSSTPPIYRNKSEWKAKSTAEVFATAKVKNIQMSQYPVFALQSHLGRKNMTFVGENFWRMRMNAYIETESFEPFDDWYFNTVKWLMVTDDKRKFRVFPSKGVFTGNEPAILKGEAYDDSYNPLSGVEMKVAVKFPNGKVNDYFLKETSAAQYYQEIYNLPQGAYTYVAEGKKGNTLLGTDKGQFSVGRADIEHINLRADAGLMQQLAVRTNGKMIHYKELDKLPDLIKQQSLKTITDFKKNKKSVMDWWQILALLLTLVSVEWIIRKWYSLL